ncbi:unnamed protein product, partial [Rotaria sordida]
FSDWHRCFTEKKDDNKYTKLDDDTKQSDKDEAIGVLRLFRFANRIDIGLMFIAMCFMLLHTSCILANLFLFGRLTGLFTIESFGGSCDHQYKNSIAPITNNNTYPQDIQLNILNEALSHK